MTKLGQILIKGLNELIDYERGEKKLIAWDDQFIYRGRVYSLEDWSKLQAFIRVLEKLELYDSND